MLFAKRNPHQDRTRDDAGGSEGGSAYSRRRERPPRKTGRCRRTLGNRAEGANAALADSRIDSLTKVANWKAFYGNLRSAAAEVAEKRGRLVVLMLDIDRFTTFNQRHGRANGDQLLRMIAAELQKTFGRGGFVARHGCDSFGIVLPGAETEAVVAMANAFRTAFASRKIINKATAQPLGVITLSIGVTEYRRGEALAHLMFRCRGALGLARTEGATA